MRSPGSETADHDLGNVALLPGFVNAHTHLDLSGMRGLIPPSSDFTGWLHRVIGFRRARSPQQVQADINAALAECLRFGTTLIGDIAGEGASWDAVAAAPLRAVVFRELLGLSPERAASAWESARAWLAQTENTVHCRAGLSPHAPYSVRASLLRSACGTGVPVCLHLAESPEELELLQHHRGPFVSLLRDLGVWDPAGLARSVDEVLQMSDGYAPTLYAHGNYLPPDAPILTNASIVYCPRTHAAFGHPLHPFPQLIARGVRVALGTDSLASNPDLDVLAEARYLHTQFPEFPAGRLLRMATLAGAEALGWGGETGSLEAGKSADVVVLPLPDAEADPHRLVLRSALPVAAVLWRGRWVCHANGERPASAGW